MKNSPNKLQIFGACLIVALAAIALLRNGRGSFSRQGGRFRHTHPAFQVDVIAQETAYPGKVIHASEGNTEVLNYVCRPDDAAVAVVAVRERLSGNDIVPHVQKAVGSDGLTYVANVRSTGKVSLISLQSGFSHRPRSVAVTIQIGPINSSGVLETIQFTKIADPHRLLVPPTGAEADAAAKIATASFDDRRGVMKIKSVGPLSSSEGIEPHLIATSFGAGTRSLPDDPFLSFVFPDNTGHDIDAARVELDRVRYDTSEATLTYKDAQIVEADGHRYLDFPTRQEVGTILDYEARISVLQHSTLPKAITKNVGSRGQIYVRLTEKLTSLLQPPSKEHTYLDSPSVHLVNVSPKPEELGLHALQIRLSDPAEIGTAISGFDQTVYETNLAKKSLPSAVPTIQIRVKIVKPVWISKTTVVLPVKHTSG